MIIEVIQNKNSISKAILKVIDDNKICRLQSNAYVGANGISMQKIEGDKKTPCGVFSLGLAFGTHKNVACKLKYININKDLYWVDDTNSVYYNQIVDTTIIKQDWITAEHLIEYPIQYEYALEIKTNPNNLKGKGSAIFLHCSNNKPTAGCIAIERDKMKDLLRIIDKNTLIEIKSSKIS